MLNSADRALTANQLDKAKKLLEEGMASAGKLSRWQIKAMQYSWTTVQEYLVDELASDTDDEKRMIRSKENQGSEKLKKFQTIVLFSALHALLKQPKTNYQFPRADASWSQAGNSGRRIPAKLAHALSQVYIITYR